MNARFFSALGLSLSLVAGCQLIPTGTAGKGKPVIKASPSLAAASGPTRTVDPTAAGNAVLKLSGVARILSDNGLGIISNNGGGIVSNNGGGIISDNGLGYRLSATSARPESRLADAVVEVLDGEGKLLVNKAGKPIGGTTDNQGRYTFDGVLPKENLVLRIRLWNGGVLTSILANADGDADALELNVDTASSLGGTYVLEQYVKQRQGVFNLLPRNEATALNEAIEAARGELAGTPSYKPADLVAAAEALRKKAQAVDERLDRIEAILLAGQKDFGNGLPATQVPLSGVTAVASDEAGTLYIAETGSRRIRKVDAHGLISQLALKGVPLGNPTAMVRAKDGTLFLACPLQLKVYKVTPDGTVSVYAGSGEKRDLPDDPLEKPATTVPLYWPTQLALAPDGTLYVGEVSKSIARDTRILAVDTAGIAHRVPTNDPIWTSKAAGETRNPSVGGLGVTADGTLVVGSRYGDRLATWTKAGGWKTLATDFQGHDYSSIAVGADGTIYASASDQHVVWAYGPDGTRRVAAGTPGTSGSSGDGGPADKAQLNEPTGLYVTGDGTLYIAEAGNALVRSVSRDGIIRTVAGTTGLATQGDVASIGVNGPSGLAVDPQGRLVLAESGTATVKRLDGKTLSVIVGSTKRTESEPSGDGGPPEKARLTAAGQIAYGGDELYFMDLAAGRLRKVGKDGKVVTVAGTTTDFVTIDKPSFKADSAFLGLPSGLAVSPDGIPYFADARNHQVYRVKGDMVEVVAGLKSPRAGGYAGDGGPAVDAQLSRPSAMAFDAAGNLFIADSGNLVIRKVTPDGTIATIAGLGLTASLTSLFAFKPGGEEGQPAAKSALVVPTSLAFDAAGNLYVAEAGTSNIDLLGSGLPVPAALIPKIAARVRKIATDGTITTVVGPGGRALTDGELLLPLGILVDREGRLIIADSVANQVWMLPKGAF